MTTPHEDDVDAEGSSALTRETGGVADAPGGDAASTTGTGVNDEFVGRVAGQDEGYAGETGAERRAAVEGNG